MGDSDDDFKEQLRLEAEAKAKEEAEKDPSMQKKVDDDGTEYEWDPKQKAWFPKIDADFIAKYQMSYGSNESSFVTTTSAQTTTNSSVVPPNQSTDSAPPPVTDPAYSAWYYQHYYSNASKDGVTSTTDSQAYYDYYNQYYAQYSAQQGSASADLEKKDSDETEMGTTSENCDKFQTKTEEGKSSPEKKEENPIASDTAPVDAESDAYSDYWSYYYNYYGYQQGQEGEAEGTKKDEKTEEKADSKAAEKPGEKRKQKDPEWFDADEKQHNNIYVSGLPTDVTEQEFEETMKKCGLIMLDPKTRKLKLKLYQDKTGSYKGDGLCCYIKSESVDLALQVLDGSELRGSTIHIERAKFKLKGEFDVSKAKKKRLSNKEKKKLREKQEKLFDWRPDKPVDARQKSDRVVVIKNVFDPAEFDADPSQINEIRNDIREECGKYGDVRKVVVYDRHLEGVVVVTLREPEEADVCIEAINGRWFGGKQLDASTWDGKSKYAVEETEEEHKARLKQWENFLEGKEGAKPAADMADMADRPVPPAQTSSSAPAAGEVPSPTQSQEAQSAGQPEEASVSGSGGHSEMDVSTSPSEPPASTTTHSSHTEEEQTAADV